MLSKRYFCLTWLLLLLCHILCYYISEIWLNSGIPSRLICKSVLYTSGQLDWGTYMVINVWSHSLSVSVYCDAKDNNNNKTHLCLVEKGTHFFDLCTLPKIQPWCGCYPGPLCGWWKQFADGLGEQPRSHTWPRRRGSPGPSLGMRGGSDNRLLSVRHGHKERAAAAAGVPLWSVRLLMAQALSHAPSWNPNTTSCRVLLWAQHRRVGAALAAQHLIFFFPFLNFLF